MVKARERSKGMFEPKRKAESLRGPFYGAKEARGSEFRVGRFRFVVRLRDRSWFRVVGRVPIRFGGENLKGKPNYDVGTVPRMVAQSIFLTGQLIRYRASCPVERFSEIRIKPSKRSFLQKNLVRCTMSGVANI